MFVDWDMRWVFVKLLISNLVKMHCAYVCMDDAVDESVVKTFIMILHPSHYLITLRFATTTQCF